MPVAPSNEEAVEAWNGVLFDRFSQFRHVILASLSLHSEYALRLYPPKPGDRALDLGCGFGDTTRRLAELVGPEGSALGIDASERFVEAARREAKEAGVSNAGFMTGDVQAADFDEAFDYVFGRCGTMFFANPVAALRNVREPMVSGGRLCTVVWRRKLDNPWVDRPEKAVQRFLDEPDHEQTDEPTCGPGPFSMADADVTSDVFLHAGFEDVALRRSDQEYMAGRDLDEAVALVMALGPAAEVIRLSGDEAERIRPELTRAIEDVMRPFERPDGAVCANASTWIVSATAP